MKKPPTCATASGNSINHLNATTMPINFKTLLKAAPCWLRDTRNGDDNVLTTVVRMVRNLPGHSFPGWSTAEDRAAVANEILPVLSSHPCFRYCHQAEMTELDHHERCIR